MENSVELHSEKEELQAKFWKNHFPDAYSMVIAGGGATGYSHGETDDLGFSVAKDKVHVHDFQATLLHLLGFDHEKLIYRFKEGTTDSLMFMVK